MTFDDVLRFGASKFGSVGRAWAGARLRVIDPDTLAELAPGKEGLLAVKTPRMGDHWIRTTDLAMIDEDGFRSEEHTSELQSLMRISYAVFCLKKKTRHRNSTSLNSSM